MKRVTSIVILCVLSCICLAQPTSGKNKNEASEREEEKRKDAELKAIEREIENIVKMAQTKTRDMKSCANSIAALQGVVFSCNLKEQEMRAAAERYVRANPVAFDSDKDRTRGCRALQVARRKLNEKKDNANQVYNEMNLEKLGITKKSWEGFVKNCNPQAPIPKGIVQNQADLDASRARTAFDTIYRFQTGLLSYKILMDYNKRHGDGLIDEALLKDWGAEASRKKEAAFKEWWSERLAPLFQDVPQRNELCQILAKDSLNGLKRFIGNVDWRPFFEEKLK